MFLLLKAERMIDQPLQPLNGRARRSGIPVVSWVFNPDLTRTKSPDFYLRTATTRLQAGTLQSVKIPLRRPSLRCPHLPITPPLGEGEEAAQPRTLWTKVRALSLLMARIIKRGHGSDKPAPGDEAGDFAERQARGQFRDDVGWGNGAAYDDGVFFHSQGEGGDSYQRGKQIGSMLDRSSGVGSKSRLSKDGAPSDMDQMKDKLSKLLLGEDMSGGGKGVSSALALSNAITNLAASIFGEQRRLEPMVADKKARWRKEIEWLLSVTNYIVEFVPSRQITNGICMEVMITQRRRDLQMNIPALRKLDTMLIGCLDNFKDQSEFWYVSRDADKGHAQRTDDKWWLPLVRVPQDGLSEASRKWLQVQKDSVNQVLKAAMAINAQVLMEMEVPEAYIESLPKNGRASLGDAIYKNITDGVFDPEEFLECMDLSSEHKIVDLKSRIEASIVIWKRKMQDKESKSSTWGSAVSFEKREQFEERAETILLLLKQRFPGISQSALDISKIQYNRDVGLSILESYSRVLESLAFTVLSRIEDVIRADSLAQNPATKSSNRRQPMPDAAPARNPEPDSEPEPTSLMTLSDFMGWNFEPESDADVKNSVDMLKKPPQVKTAKKFSYIDKIGHAGGTRSPTARH